MVKNFSITLNNLPQTHFKLFSKKALQKMEEATTDLIGNKIANKILSLKKITID